MNILYSDEKFILLEDIKFMTKKNQQYIGFLDI